MGDFAGMRMYSVRAGMMSASQARWTKARVRCVSMAMAPTILLRDGRRAMPLLPLMTREQVDPEVRPLWDECERLFPAFRHLWATQAHSPIVFRHVWGQLLELKRKSPVEARHFEIGIVVASSLNRCRYCVSHHAPLAEATGLTAAQVESLAALTLDPLPDDHDFPLRPGFTPEDSLVIDLAYFL